MLDAQKTATENAQTLGLSLEKVPNTVNRSNLGCTSTYSNRSPYERSWNYEGGSTNIENKFTVLIDIDYAFKKDGESSTQSEKVKESSEKNRAETDAQG